MKLRWKLKVIITILLLAIFMLLCTNSTFVHADPTTSDMTKEEIYEEFEYALEPLCGYLSEVDYIISQHKDMLKEYLDNDNETAESFYDRTQVEYHDIYNNFVEIIRTWFVNHSSECENAEDIIGTFEEGVGGASEMADSNSLIEITNNAIREFCAEKIENELPLVFLSFEDLSIDDIDTFNETMDKYHNLEEMYLWYLDLVAKDYEYITYTEMFEDLNYLFQFLSYKAEYEAKAEKLLYTHDSEDIKSEFNFMMESFDALVYERCYEDRYTYLSDLENSVYECYSGIEDSISYMQEFQRFNNYFDWFRKTIEKDKYSDDALSEIESIINEAYESIEYVNNAYEIKSLREETINKINQVETLKLDTDSKYFDVSYNYKGSISEVSGINNVYSLTVYKSFCDYEWANKVYEIDLISEDGDRIIDLDSPAHIQINDNLDGIEFKLYVMKGEERVELDYEYSDGVISFYSDKLDSVYLSYSIKRPYVAMIITFSSLIVLSIGVVAILKWRKFI